ncbi:hypothetical protein Anapl_02714 [Anas platyrhynchos]|uniref:Uncharacterized protein n=1 Tax=Anas platyrhynchos TaxID=8839 RepID=R0JDX9_ANAPL|nr:hypothetical protein Anapl_02714 [Anas platyrhynchos]
MEFLTKYLKRTTVIFLKGSAFVDSRSISILPRHCKSPTSHTAGGESGVRAPGFPTVRSDWTCSFRPQPNKTALKEQYLPVQTRCDTDPSFMLTQLYPFGGKVTGARTHFSIMPSSSSTPALTLNKLLTAMKSSHRHYSCASNSDESARCPHGSMEGGNTLPRVLNLIPYSFAPFASCTQNLSNYHQIIGAKWNSLQTQNYLSNASLDLARTCQTQLRLVLEFSPIIVSTHYASRQMVARCKIRLPGLQISNTSYQQGTCASNSLSSENTRTACFKEDSSMCSECIPPHSARAASPAPARSCTSTGAEREGDKGCHWTQPSTALSHFPSQRKPEACKTTDSGRTRRIEGKNHQWASVHQEKPPPSEAPRIPNHD